MVNRYHVQSEVQGVGGMGVLLLMILILVYCFLARTAVIKYLICYFSCNSRRKKISPPII